MKLTLKAIAHRDQVGSLSLAHEFWVCLLDWSEYPKDILDEVKKDGCSVVHIPTCTTKWWGLSRWPSAIYHISNYLIVEPYDVLIHCSDGITRTGAFTYAFLLANGVEEHKALEILGSLDPKAAQSPYLYVAKAVAQRVRDFRVSAGEPVDSLVLLGDLLSLEGGTS